MPRFFLKTVSILTLAALTACSDSKEYSNPSFGPSLGFRQLRQRPPISEQRQTAAQRCRAH